MNLLTKLERSLGWMAVGNLPVYVVSAQAILYIWTLMNPGQEVLLMMDPSRVLSGEWWRVLTFLFLPPFQHPFFALIYLYFQYVVGQALENEWGSFRLTMFYLVGAVGCIIGAFVSGLAIREPFFLYDTLFLAFAALYPELRVLLIVIPVKAKWLAWVTWARILWVMFGSPRIVNLAILISLSNYFLFFAGAHVEALNGWVRLKMHRRRFKDFRE